MKAGKRILVIVFLVGVAAGYAMSPGGFAAGWQVGYIVGWNDCWDKERKEREVLQKAHELEKQAIRDQIEHKHIP